MDCILCEKQILQEDLKFYIPIEKPYVNIKIHRDCLLEKGYVYILQYLTKNPKIVYNYIEYTNNNAKNRRK